PRTGPRPRRKFDDLSQPIKDQLRGGGGGFAGGPPGGPPLPSFNIGGGDHSNTQFAVFALSVGRRLGLPVAKSWHLVAEHFRATQNADGGWGYTPYPKDVPPGVLRPPPGGADFGGPWSSPAMTCAGLLGIALGYGVANETVLSTRMPGTGGAGGHPAPPPGGRSTPDPSKTAAGRPTPRAPAPPPG